MPLKVRTWTCKDCGTEHDRDINAALVIKRLGILELKALKALALEYIEA